MLRQRVLVTIYETAEGGGIVFQDDRLRVDFDVRNIPDYSRATITIYNLNADTIRSIMNGERYASVSVQLHDGVLTTVIDKFIINNSVDEIKLPERTLKLFCFNQLRSNIEKDINVIVKRPSLENIMESLCTGIGIDPKPNYVNFPRGLEKEVPKPPSRTLTGTGKSCLKDLEREFQFDTFTIGNKLTLSYRVDLEQLAKTALLDKEGEIILHTENMRANPKIGLASAEVTSNLDPRILPAQTLDFSQLLTRDLSVKSQSLEIAGGLASIAAGYQKYVAFSVAHRGSNYTNQWTTVVTCQSPTKGRKMATGGSNWAKTTSRS